MDADQFDQFVTSLASVSSRRGILRLFFVLPIGGVLAPSLPEESVARDRHRHARLQRGAQHRNRVDDEKKKKKKKKHAAPPALPPPPPPPGPAG